MTDRDDELLAAARSGDARALERLLERHQRRVFRFGLKMCGREEEASDVLQETLLAAARGIREFRGASSVSTWLYAIARSFCTKARRTSKFATAQVESLSDVTSQANEIPDQARGPDELAAGVQVQSALQDAISALEPMYREILVLRDVEGLSAAEVAEITNLSVEAVKSRLHRARVSVRERIAPLLGIVEQDPPTARAKQCPDIVELFSKHLEGEISGTVCATLEQHLLGCERCRARCDSLRATLSLCSHSGGDLSPRVEQSVREALRGFLATDAGASGGR